MALCDSLGLLNPLLHKNLYLAMRYCNFGGTKAAVPCEGSLQIFACVVFLTRSRNLFAVMLTSFLGVCFSEQEKVGQKGTEMTLEGLNTAFITS